VVIDKETPTLTIDPNVWPGTQVDSWSALSHLCAETAALAASGRNILLRGQAADWDLRPTFLRDLRSGTSPSDAAITEKKAMEHFKSQAHIHEPSMRTSIFDTRAEFFEWWAAMQHHRAPTRLLDWTASPYVAAYFAAEQGPGTDGVVLVIDADAIAQKWKDTIGEEFEVAHFFGSPPSALRAFTPFRKSARLVAQQGYFTVATSPLTAHDALLASAGAILRRWVVPAALKPVVLLHLRTMNVTAGSLFPGLDGLGRSTRELVLTAGIKTGNPTA